MGASEKEQARMVLELEKHYPGTLQDLKRWKLQDAVDRSFRQMEQGSKAPLKAEALINELTNGRSVAGKLLWTPRERQDIEAGISYLRLIQSRSSLKDKGVEPQRVAMAMWSRAGAFVVGQSYKVMVNPNMERMFFSAKGREVLRTLALAPKDSAKYVAASGWLAAQTAATMNERGTLDDAATQAASYYSDEEPAQAP
jgi:hypothetical protein